MTDNRLGGEVAIITGAASGIGEATARLFAAHGAQVMLSDIEHDAGQAVADEIGENARFVRADVTDADDWTRLVDATQQEFGPVSVLVNNAGGSIGIRNLMDEDYDSHKGLIDLNVTSVWMGMRAVQTAMKERGGGSIVNISSIDGIIGVAQMTTYVGTKFAVTGMTRSASLELGQHGIRVNAVHPGIIATPMVLTKSEAVQSRMAAATRNQPISRMGRPEEIANAVMFFAAAESSYCTGSSLVVDGGHIAGPIREAF